MNARHVLLLSVSVLLTHCKGEDTLGYYFGKVRQTSKLQSDPVTASSEVSPSEATTIRISSGALAGSQVVIPAGGTDEDVSIILGETSFPSEFSVLMPGGGKLVTASVPLEISATNRSGQKLSSAKIPMIITIPISEAAMALMESPQNRDQLCVLLKTNNNALFMWRRNEISIDGNKAVVSSRYFGTYQLAYCGNAEVAGFSESKAFKLASSDCVDPNLASVLAGVSLMLCDGTLAVGTLQQARSCAEDAQVGCITTSRFKSADTNALQAQHVMQGYTVAGVTGTISVDPWDIRQGVSVGNVTGKLKASCRNAINSSVYNRDLGSDGSINNAVMASGSAGSQLDWWDTLDDTNNYLAPLPTELPSGWDASTQCDAGNWLDMTRDGACDSASDECVYKDRITNLSWTEKLGEKNWGEAVVACNDLDFGGHSDWRLPTQKEFLAAYINGIRDLSGRGGLGNSNFLELETQGTASKFWTATSSASTGAAWFILPGMGYAWSATRTDLHKYLCVR